MSLLKGNTDFIIKRQKFDGQYHLFVLEKYAHSPVLIISPKQTRTSILCGYLSLTDEDLEILKNGRLDENLELNRVYRLEEYLTGNIKSLCKN